MEDSPVISSENLELEFDGEVVSLDLERNSAIRQNLLERFGESRAREHQDFCDLFTSMTNLLERGGTPLTPHSYFLASITAIDNYISSSSTSSNSKVESAYCNLLTTSLLNFLPLLPSQSLPSPVANRAVSLLVSLLKIHQSTTVTILQLLVCLIIRRDLDDWKSAKSAFEVILEFSIDKRPEIRESAQMSVRKIYESGHFANEASELFHSMMFYKYLSYSIALAWSEIEITEDSKQAEELMLMECVHMLSVLKIIVGYLSNDVVLKIMSQIHKIMGSMYSRLTRPLFAFLEACFESSRAEQIIGQKTEIIIYALGKYVSPKWNNPVDTLLSASLLLKRCIDKLHDNRRIIWLLNIPLVFEAIAGIVGAGLSVSGEATNILNELVNQHIDDDLKASASVDRTTVTPESKALESVCAAIDKMQLTHSDGGLNEDVLSVVKQMFLKLGGLSYIYLEGVIHKLTELLRVANGDPTKTNHQHIEALLAILEQNPAACGVMNLD